MALTINAFHASQATGSVGPITCFRNSYGQSCRSRIRGVKQRSTESSVFRQRIFNEVVYQWSNLGLSSLQQWQNFAEHWKRPNKLGQLQKLSAYNWYLRFQIPRLKFLNDTIELPPPHPICAYLPKINIEWSGSGAYLTFDSPIGANQRIVVYQQRNVLTTQTRNRRSRFAWILDSSNTSPVFISPDIGSSGTPDGFPTMQAQRLLDNWVFTVDFYGRTSNTIKFSTYTT